MGDYQCGFVNKKSTVNVIHIMKQFAVKAACEHNVKIKMLLIDFHCKH